MKTSHIVIGAAVAGVVGFLWYRSRKPAATTSSSSIASKLQDAATRLRAAFTSSQTPKEQAAPAVARADELGLDISSPYGNESPAL